jgi:alanine racemase
MNENQLARFRSCLKELPNTPASLSASAGAPLGSEFHFDLLRPGIGLYGGNPQPALPNPFRSVATVSAPIGQIQWLQKGESAGYGATYRADEPRLIATVMAGYADGLDRRLSNSGFAHLKGIQVPIIGRVSMDCIALDITDVKDEVKIGSSVELLGDHVRLDDLAARNGTIANEVLTGLGARLDRRYVPLDPTP